jgi:hypothetical protein
MLEVIEPGLGESQVLSAVGRDAGMLIGGTEGMCRGMEEALMWDIDGELVEERVLQLILRSSIALSDGTAEIKS